MQRPIQPKRSTYLSTFSQSTGRLLSKPLISTLDHPQFVSLTEDTVFKPSKSIARSTPRSVRSSIKQLPLISDSSTPKADALHGLPFSKQSNTLAINSTPRNRSRGVFAFETKEDNESKASSAWIQGLNSPKETSKKEKAPLIRYSRPNTGRLSPTQTQFKIPRHRQVGTESKAEEPAKSPILFQKTSQIVRKQTSPRLGALVTKVEVSPPRFAFDSLSETELQAQKDRIYREHLNQTFEALKIVRSLAQPDSLQLKAKRVTLTKREGYAGKKTMIFDLDETLVHCLDTTQNADVTLPIRFHTGEVINVRTRQAGINIRPYARKCLEAANKDFEVIVFTASHKCYADVVLDHLDPTGTLIHHRLYRDSCISIDGMYIKDLRVISNRRLQDMLIVDNAAYSFGYQLDNGIPIISWSDNRHDRELLNLIDYMKTLAHTDDVRTVNAAIFRLNTFYEDYLQEFCGDHVTKAATRRKIRCK